jgi:hypothetical protein
MSGVSSFCVLENPRPLSGVFALMEGCRPR